MLSVLFYTLLPVCDTLIWYLLFMCDTIASQALKYAQRTPTPPCARLLPNVCPSPLVRGNPRCKNNGTTWYHVVAISRYQHISGYYHNRNAAIIALPPNFAINTKIAVKTRYRPYILPRCISIFVRLLGGKNTMERQQTETNEQINKQTHEQNKTKLMKQINTHEHKNTHTNEQNKSTKQTNADSGGPSNEHLRPSSRTACGLARRNRNVSAAVWRSEKEQRRQLLVLRM